MSGLINQTLPEAVRKHLQVMEIELPAGRPVLVEAALVDDHGERWIGFQSRPRLGPEIIEWLREFKATKVEIRFSGAGRQGCALLSEFDIEEMVW